MRAGKVVKDAIIDLDNDVIADGEDSAEGILIDVDVRKEGRPVDVDVEGLHCPILIAFERYREWGRPGRDS